MQDDLAPHASVPQLAERIGHYVDDLARCTDATRMSDDLQRFLSACAQFHRYSWNNTLMILLARPDATRVAGFQTWKKLGRYVKRGEHGIPILVPIKVRATQREPAVDPGEATQREPTTPALRVGFKVGYVFDVSQTEGQELPPAPDWRSPDRHEVVHARLLAFCASVGITVRTGHLPGDAQGASHGGTITLRDAAGTQTLIHELAHELLHRNGETLGRQVAEIEAEAVGYVVACHFGLEGLNCPTYLALWGADAHAIRDRLRAISACATRIIVGLEDSEPIVSASASGPGPATPDTPSIETEPSE